MDKIDEFLKDLKVPLDSYDEAVLVTLIEDYAKSRYYEGYDEGYEVGSEEMATK